MKIVEDNTNCLLSKIFLPGRASLSLGPTRKLFLNREKKKMDLPGAGYIEFTLFAFVLQ
jgi:hypothetical protein